MFIAMNRFRVLPGQEAAFEQVWLGRDTHLGGVPGFVAFHLLRGPTADDHTLFSSHTVWRSKADFERWGAFVRRGGGHVLFHDAVDSGGYGNFYPGIAQLMTEINRTARALKESFEAAELGSVETRNAQLGESTENEIALLRPAMP